MTDSTILNSAVDPAAMSPPAARRGLTAIADWLRQLPFLQAPFFQAILAPKTDPPSRPQLLQLAPSPRSPHIPAFNAPPQYQSWSQEEERAESRTKKLFLSTNTPRTLSHHGDPGNRQPTFKTVFVEDTKIIWLNHWQLPTWRVTGVVEGEKLKEHDFLSLWTRANGPRWTGVIVRITDITVATENDHVLHIQDLTHAHSLLLFLICPKTHSNASTHSTQPQLPRPESLKKYASDTLAPPLRCALRKTPLAPPSSPALPLVAPSPKEPEPTKLILDEPRLERDITDSCHVSSQSDGLPINPVIEDTTPNSPRFKAVEENGFALSMDAVQGDEENFVLNARASSPTVPRELTSLLAALG